MANNEILTKQVAINKANTQMVLVVGIAAFVTVFCLFAAKAVWSQNSYQARVTTAKDVAHKQLLTDLSAYGSTSTPNTLTYAYEKFVQKTPNVIGGAVSGTGTNVGNNAQIILDALPPSYDFPGLTSSVEKILDQAGFTNTTITGTDDELNQENNNSSADPTPVPMPFTFTITDANYASIQQLIDTLQNSIRPIQIDTMEISGGGNAMTLDVTAHTYYQPSKSLTITEKEVQ